MQNTPLEVIDINEARKEVALTLVEQCGESKYVTFVVL